MYKITVMGEEKQYPEGTTYGQIVEEYQGRFEDMIALVAADGKIRELFKTVKKDCKLTFFTLRDDVGYKTYVRTATMMFLKAVFDVFGPEAAKDTKVEYSIGH